MDNTMDIVYIIDPVWKKIYDMVKGDNRRHDSVERTDQLLYDIYRLEENGVNDISPKDSKSGHWEYAYKAHDKHKYIELLLKYG